jgi:hypothetical protein
VSCLHAIDVGVIVKPERKVICSWSTAIDTVTVGELMQILIPYFPQYEDDKDVKLHFYRTHASPPESIRNDDHRRILRVGKTQSMSKHPVIGKSIQDFLFVDI